GFDGGLFHLQSDLTQTFPDVLTIARVNDQQRIGAPAALEVLLHFCNQTWSGLGVIDSLHQCTLSANLGPARHQGRGETRTRCVVWILAGGGLDAVAARLLHQVDRLFALAPDIWSQCFDVRDVHRYLRFATDANRLFNRAEQSNCVRTFVAHVRVVDSTFRSCDLSELDDFFGLRVALWRVIQAGRHAEGAVIHRLRNVLLHLLELCRRGLGVGWPNYFPANRPKTGE